MFKHWKLILRAKRIPVFLSMQKWSGILPQAHRVIYIYVIYDSVYEWICVFGCANILGLIYLMLYCFCGRRLIAACPLKRISVFSSQVPLPTVSNGPTQRRAILEKKSTPKRKQDRTIMAKPHFFWNIKKHRDIRWFEGVILDIGLLPLPSGLEVYLGREKTLQETGWDFGRWPLAPLRQHLGGSREARKFIGTLV